MPGVTEIIDLDPNEQVQLLGEIDAAARALKSVTKYEKLNVAALGNVVAQLHVHVIGRRHTDAAWPKPVWGVAPPVAYTPAVRDGLTALRRASPSLHIATARLRGMTGGRAHCAIVSPACDVPARMPPRPDLGPKPRLGYTDSRLERAAELPHATPRRWPRCGRARKPAPM